LYSVVFAPEAIDQLESLLTSISERSSLAIGARYTEAVMTTCEKLALFPMRGVARDDIRPGLRLSHHKGRTVIAYIVDDSAQRLSVVGVFYGGQDHEALLVDSRDN
jgi:plasmid stabilization system protein ParE